MSAGKGKDTDMMDITGCPVADACEVSAEEGVCGSTNDLRVDFFIYPEDSDDLPPDAGVFCYTACRQHTCAPPEEIPRVRDHIRDAVHLHCEHLGVTHNDMIAWMQDI